MKNVLDAVIALQLVLTERVILILGKIIQPKKQIMGRSLLQNLRVNMDYAKKAKAPRGMFVNVLFVCICRMIKVTIPALRHVLKRAWLKRFTLAIWVRIPAVGASPIR